MSHTRAAVALAGLTTALVVGLDQALKAIVRGEIALGERIDVVGSALRLVHVENKGVAFGQLSGSALVGVLVAAALVALVAFFVTHLRVPLIWLPTGLLLGGALGNVLDRLRAGAVTDYVKLPSWPAFNLADMCISVGVVLLLVLVELDARRRARATAGAGERADGAEGRA